MGNIPSTSGPQGSGQTRAPHLRCFGAGDGDICDTMFSFLPFPSLVRFERVSKVAQYAVRKYHKRQYKLHRQLSRFISDTYAFRVLQARTATLISGSFVLQFFSDAFYPESDLDLYAHSRFAYDVGRWLVQREGYILIPGWDDCDPLESVTPNQSKEDEDGIPQEESEGGFDEVEDCLQHYGVMGVKRILTFRKPTTVAGEKERKVQIMVATESPLKSILAFHSTCVMNLITWDHGNSLYPQATLELRRGVIATDNPMLKHAVEKYQKRGYNILPSLSFEDEKKAPFYPGVTRWVDDNMSLVLPLDRDGFIRPHPPLSVDPVACNGWVLKIPEWGKGVSMESHIIASRIFMFKHSVGNERLQEKIMEFAREQEDSQIEAAYARSQAAKDGSESDVDEDSSSDTDSATEASTPLSREDSSAAKSEDSSEEGSEESRSSSSSEADSQRETMEVEERWTHWDAQIRVFRDAFSAKDAHKGISQSDT